LSGLKYGVLLVLSILPSTFNFNPPENKDKTFSGGVNDCVETANSFNYKLLHFFLLESNLRELIISSSETPFAKL
jgi:hypothetical protein